MGPSQAYGVPMGSLWGAYGVPMGSRWGPCEEPMGSLWGAYSETMGSLWAAYASETSLSPTPQEAGNDSQRTLLPAAEEAGMSRN